MESSVLIVDDDPSFRGLAARILAARGLSVAGEAGTVEQAIEAASRLKPQAALVDIGLPDGSGVDLAKALAALPWRPRVLLTSSDDTAAAECSGDSSEHFAFVPKADLPNAPLRWLLTRD
jgi:DNA-binding NarL/FixJ family response regulator